MLHFLIFVVRDLLRGFLGQKSRRPQKTRAVLSFAHPLSESAHVVRLRPTFALSQRLQVIIFLIRHRI
jgi:hypothetical protein